MTCAQVDPKNADAAVKAKIDAWRKQGVKVAQVKWKYAVISLRRATPDLHNRPLRPSAKTFREEAVVTPGNAPLACTCNPAAAFIIGLALGFPFLHSHAQNNPFGQLGEAIKQKAAERTVGALLNNNLPLKLDANAVYPAVAAPPGGPFSPQPLTLTAADLDRPLPPGDYTMNVLAFCTEYSVHRPGAGVAYRLGPLQGKAAAAIGDLLWRGTLNKNIEPQQLQAVSWAIQSGLRYDQMPKSYQSVIDNVIPDHRNELNGDFFQSMEDSYNSLAKGTRLPPLQQLLAGMGKSGQLALSADASARRCCGRTQTTRSRSRRFLPGNRAGSTRL